METDATTTNIYQKRVAVSGMVRLPDSKTESMLTSNRNNTWSGNVKMKRLALYCIDNY